MKNPNLDLLSFAPSTSTFSPIKFKDLPGPAQDSSFVVSLVSAADVAGTTVNLTVVDEYPSPLTVMGVTAAESKPASVLVPGSLIASFTDALGMVSAYVSKRAPSKTPADLSGAILSAYDASTSSYHVAYLVYRPVASPDPAVTAVCNRLTPCIFTNVFYVTYGVSSTTGASGRRRLLQLLEIFAKSSTGGSCWRYINGKWTPC